MTARTNWQAATVADICEMRNGHGFGPEDWKTEGLPIIRIQNLNGGSNFDYYAGEPDPRWIVESGQLLFAWAGTKGVSFGPTVWRGLRGVLNQHIFKVYPKSGIDSGWLYWALRQVTDRIEVSAHGFKATLVHVKKSDIDRQTVKVPALHEQRRIAQILTIWDEAIATAERLFESSRAMSRSLADTTLMGRRSIHSGESHLKKFASGTLPKDWRYARIEEVAEEVSHKPAPGTEYQVLSCTKHEGLVDSLSYFKKRIFSAHTSLYKVASRGCFVYATNHIEEGSIGYQDIYEVGLVSPMYTVFRTNDLVFDTYLYAVLKTEHYRQVFASSTNASVDRRGSLRWKDFRKLHIPLPPMREQEAIAEMFQQSNRRDALLRSYIELLRGEKTALMADLLTGNRRVRLPVTEATP